MAPRWALPKSGHVLCRATPVASLRIPDTHQVVPTRTTSAPAALRIQSLRLHIAAIDSYVGWHSWKLLMVEPERASMIIVKSHVTGTGAEVAAEDLRRVLKGVEL